MSKFLKSEKSKICCYDGINLDKDDESRHIQALTYSLLNEIKVMNR